MIYFRHHSRLLTFRRPQGAAPCGSSVHIEAECGEGGASVQLRLYRQDGTESFYELPVNGARASADIPMPQEPCLVWYYFIIHLQNGQTLFYGADSGEGALQAHEPRAYQITVYDGSFQTPQSWREGIVYQIFPDRFRRSSWEDFRARAQYHVEKGRFIRLHDRWSEEVSYSPIPGLAEYEPNDFFGGDCNGIREKLPYLKELGVTTIYLNPIFESSSNHRYDTADYHRIDPIFGTEEEFTALCREAKEFGIRVMLDGVFSHTGADSRYFDKFSRYEDEGAYESESSPYKKWYTFQGDCNHYDCWWGFPTLPNVVELEPSYTEFITGDDGVLSHWARIGACDWRLDVADELPDEFIRILHRRVKQNDPEGVLLGEVWDDCSNKYSSDGRRGYVDGDELDSTMNYPFTEAVLQFLTGHSDAYALDQSLQTLREHYPQPFYEACLNLISSHDIIRAATALAGAPDRNAVSRKMQATFHPSEQEKQKGFRRLILATALQMALPGVPCVYYGDEAGMTGMADPFNRGTYPWGAENPETMAAFQALMHARRDSLPLKRGLCRMGALSPEVFAAIRYLPQGGEVAVLMINRSEREQSVSFHPDWLTQGPDGETDVTMPDQLKDVLTGTVAVTEHGELKTTLPPLTARLWIG
ncbi:MAG TPA: alpha-amylase family glycosyl hydrolase [Feifaniaceae bacterium]|nr:alpha-amylase family glycosyl hydrolase [Feifaniaceae bacterium]